MDVLHYLLSFNVFKKEPKTFKFLIFCMLVSPISGSLRNLHVVLRVLKLTAMSPNVDQFLPIKVDI